jgi:Zn-dependent peptidase ImmA (M78 family)/DNA-binding XRE family transcriptional regulator
MINITESKESLIIGSQLKKARELLMLEPKEVAIKIGVNVEDIIIWEQERLRPNIKQLEALARLYGREIDYFVKETPSIPEKIEFRGKPKRSFRSLSLEVRKSLSRFDELCRTAIEFENLLNKGREIKLPHFKISDTPPKVAQTLREKFRIGDKPLFDLKERFEDEGVRIFELPIPEDAFSGFSFWHKEYGPCILINAKELRGRKNFTLAHELFHLLINYEATLCYISETLSRVIRDIEYKANQFAIELLLPQSGVMEDFKKRGIPFTPSGKELGRMAYKWSVSFQALGYRLEALGLIKKGHTKALFEPKPFFKGGHRLPRWEKQLGGKYVETTVEAYKKGLISIGKLSYSLGITVREAMKEIEQRGR